MKNRTDQQPLQRCILRRNSRLLLPGCRVWAGRGGLFLAILLMSLGPLRGQTPVRPPMDSLARTHDDRSTVRARYPAAERVRAYQNDRDYQYERDTAPPPDLLEKFLRWLFSLFGKVSAHPVYVNGGQYVLLALVLAGAIWLLRKADMLGFLFPAKAKSSPLDYETMTENIYAINFDDRIEEALAARNYRLAVRLLYLRTLKQLTDRNLIAWQPDKTNRQYAYELANSPLSADFEQLTTQFEFIWYGNFPIDERRFNEIAAKFNQFAPVEINRTL